VHRSKSGPLESGWGHQRLLPQRNRAVPQSADSPGAWAWDGRPI